MIKNNDFLQCIKQVVLSQDPLAHISLFGSRSRGDAKDDSDWDILILLDNDSYAGQTEKQITDALYDLELETGQVINPLIYSEKEWYQKYRVTPFFEQVMNENTIL